MSDGPEWFAPKRYGFGAGRPISWQGWALTIAFILPVVGLSVLLRHRVAALVGAIAPLAIAFAVVSSRTTRGGAHWRWGDDD